MKRLLFSLLIPLALSQAAASAAEPPVAAAAPAPVAPYLKSEDWGQPEDWGQLT